MSLSVLTLALAASGVSLLPQRILQGLPHNPLFLLVVTAWMHGNVCYPSSPCSRVHHVKTLTHLLRKIRDPVVQQLVPMNRTPLHDRLCRFHRRHSPDLQWNLV
jgi:hypothetical protein